MPVRINIGMRVRRKGAAGGVGKRQSRQNVPSFVSRQEMNGRVVIRILKPSSPGGCSSTHLVPRIVVSVVILHVRCISSSLWQSFLIFGRPRKVQARFDRAIAALGTWILVCSRSMRERDDDHDHDEDDEDDDDDGRINYKVVDSVEVAPHLCGPEAEPPRALGVK